MTAYESVPNENKSLSTDAIARLQKELLLEKTELIAARDELAKILADDAVAETAEATTREECEALFASHEETIADVDVALGMIKDGTYGQCIKCGASIAVERLEALPSATSCIACQSGANISPLRR